MTCKDFSGMIPDFFNDRLDNASLKAFLDHHRTCKGCREELEIQYLVGRAFEQMEVIAEYYDNEVETATARAMSVLEPTIIVVLAVIVFVLLLSVYLPMFTMYGGIGA